MMRPLYSLLFYGLFLFSQSQPVLAVTKLSNQLREHSSPYLALHGSDPVAWQQWQRPAVERARKENKLLYLSIGYFSCHWCHVMQKESYKNKKIAKFLNKNFIPVKIDRELEPALDARMIAFTEATRGMAGWPLNVFLTPEGYPLYAVLYVPPENFLETLKEIKKVWSKDYKRMAELARDAVKGGEGPGKPVLDHKKFKLYSRAAMDALMESADILSGGFGNQSKFPSVPHLKFMLAHLKKKPDNKAEDFLRLTLDEMASNGLYDHIGNGFFRYTVDSTWSTPHFEKMLYDNAQLASLYLDAWQQFGNVRYQQIALKTLEFLKREMLTPAGVLIASLSAVDEAGREGGYYLWTKRQLSEILDDREFDTYIHAWSIQGSSPFESGYLPVKGMDNIAIGRVMGVRTSEVSRLLESARQKLLNARMLRKIPRDSKVLAAWNGLALAAFSKAAKLTGDPSYRSISKGMANYIRTTLWNGKVLYRFVDKGRAEGNVSLEDYAFVSRGLLGWARLTGEPKDYQSVQEILMRAWSDYYTPRGWQLEKQDLIPIADSEDIVFDGALPSPSATIIATSLEVADKVKDSVLRKQALGALNTGHEMLEHNPFWFVTHIGVMVNATYMRHEKSP